MKKDKDKIIKIYDRICFILLIVFIGDLLLQDRLFNIELPYQLWPSIIGLTFLMPSLLGLHTNTFHFFRLHIDLEDNPLLAKILNLIGCLFSIALIVYGFIMLWSDSV